MKVFRQADSEQPGRPDGNVGVAGEIEINLRHKGGQRHPNGQRGITTGIGKHHVHQDGEPVGQDHLPEQAKGDPRQPGLNILQRDLLIHHQLAKKVGCALDRTGHQLGEEGDIHRKGDHVPIRRDLPPVDLERVTHRLERVEGNADGQDQPQRAPRHVETQ